MGEYRKGVRHVKIVTREAQITSVMALKISIFLTQNTAVLVQAECLPPEAGVLSNTKKAITVPSTVNEGTVECYISHT